MFDGLIALAEKLIDVLSPMTVVRTYERGVRVNRGEVQVEAHAPLRTQLKDFLLFNFLLFRSMDRDVLESDGRPDYSAHGDPLVQPGVRLRLKGLYEIEKFDMRVNPEDLGEVNVVLRDKTSLTIIATVTLEISDPILTLVTVQDYLNSFRDTAQVFLARELRDKTLEEVVEDTSAIEKALLKELKARGRKWGISVLDVGFPSMVPVTNYKVFGLGSMVTAYA